MDDGLSFVGILSENLACRRRESGGPNCLNSITFTFHHPKIPSVLCKDPCVVLSRFGSNFLVQCLGVTKKSRLVMKMRFKALIYSRFLNSPFFFCRWDRYVCKPFRAHIDHPHHRRHIIRSTPSFPDLPSAFFVPRRHFILHLTCFV